MAQRTIHYLLGRLLLREEPVGDAERFLLGCLLPDAYADLADRPATHFINRSIPGMHYFDYDAFRERFAAQMGDPLYQGYCLHLLEDNCYRLFFRQRLALPIDPEDAEQVAALHRDYRLLNARIVARYGLRCEVEHPAAFAREPLSTVAAFATEDFLAAFARDFTEKEEGELRFLTEAALEEYLDGCYPLCLEALRALRHGGRLLPAADLAWTDPN